MGAIAPLIIPALAGAAVGTAIGSGLKPSTPVQAPPVPRAIEPPKAVTDTTQASEGARKKAPTGLIGQNIITGELIPKTEQKKKKFLLG
jgi:hypothetical protein